MQPQNYYFLHRYFQEKYGAKIRKLILPGGVTCPNRDGTLSTSGCAFCGPTGSGDSVLATAEDWQQSIVTSKNLQKRKYHAEKFFLYFQNFTSIYQPHPLLRKILPFIASQDDIVGVAFSARPDFLDDNFLHDIQTQIPHQEKWLEIGLQSAHDASLQRMNRCHTAQDFADAVQHVHALGYQVCAHIIAGLPQETFSDWLATIRFINALPISGLKIHPLHIVQNSRWAEVYAQQKLILQERDTYLLWVVEALAHLRPDIVVHRLTGEIDGNHLIAPAYCREKLKLLNDIHRMLIDRNIVQGMQYEAKNI